jgi:DNA-directed RNA polymerase sigma subunit (sigma70/sigma32)
LADEYGVSAERIRQIESKAMKTIRTQMTQMKMTQLPMPQSHLKSQIAHAS